VNLMHDEQYPDTKDEQVAFMERYAKGTTAQKVVAKFWLLHSATAADRKLDDSSVLVVAMATVFGCTHDEAREAIALMNRIGMRVRVQ
jgi:hypothetical protein